MDRPEIDQEVIRQYNMIMEQQKQAQAEKSPWLNMLQEAMKPGSDIPFKVDIGNMSVQRKASKADGKSGNSNIQGAIW